MLLLKDISPALIDEWDYELNEVDPMKIAASTHKRVHWKCVNGHRWEASVANRSRKAQGCPYCSGRLPIFGHDDLFSTNPELKKEWNYKKNININPNLLKATSSKKVWWICSKGHEWETRILYRGSRGHGCPYCSGQMVMPGYNDLESQYKDIALEWDYEKNEEKPALVSAKNVKKYWWICSICGYSYHASIYNRTHNNSGCPRCNLRNKTSFPEQTIFFYIKKEFPDAINGYKPSMLNGMELDIYIPEIRTSIEYDGLNWHKSKISKENKPIFIKVL